VGQSVPEVAASLKAGSSGIRLVQLPRLSGSYPAGVVDGAFSHHFTRLEQPFLDRTHEMAIVAARQAIDDAGLDTFEAYGPRAGVYYGNVNGGAVTVQNLCEDLLVNGKEKSRPFTAMAIMSNAGAAHIGIRNGIRGPVVTHASACASSGVAIGEAVRAIADGYLDVAVAGGAEAPLTGALISVFDGTRALSKADAADPSRSCKPFSKERSGLVLGEGAAFLMLESEAHARERGARIHGYLLGYGVTSDAHHIGMPDTRGQVECLRQALANAGVTAAQVQYVNAHATATHGGDIIEAAAIREVFGDGPDSAFVSSTKSVHGHLLGGTSALECVLTVVAINESVLPASAHIGEPDERCSLNHVGAHPRGNCQIDVAVSFSCGFGGTNAALVIGSPRSHALSPDP
jgi:3-oxoacyl-[acyl-carrier-protein] synthase II